MDYQKIIDKYYTDNNLPLRELLITHSRQVADFSMKIIESKGLRNAIDAKFVYTAAMLHDIGVFATYAPSIHCHGTENYMRHGIIGANLLRKENPEFEPYALVCERHIGVGLTTSEIIEQKLPLPAKDYLPVTLEEKIVCYADNFFSKSHIAPPTSLDNLRIKMQKYGAGSVERLEQLIEIFGFPI